MLSPGFFIERKDKPISSCFTLPLSNGIEGFKKLYEPITGFHDNPSPQKEEQIFGKVELPMSRAGDSPDQFNIKIFYLGSPESTIKIDD